MIQKKLPFFYKLSSFLLVLLANPQAVCADNWEVPHIQVSGIGTVETQPQLLRWQIEIKNEGSDITELAKLHNYDVSRALKKISELGVLDKKVQTNRPRLSERYIRKNNNSVKDGFIASTQISFELLDLEKYHEVWLVLSSIDGLRIHDSSWGIEVSHQHKLNEEARILALNNAKEKASQLADELNMELLHPLKITDTNYATPYRGMEQMRFSSDAMVSNVKSSHAAGTLSVNASINVTFEMRLKE
jgi:uncharacterized protein YggE